MTIRTFALIAITFVAGACVQLPVFKSEDHALLRSNYPIVELNGLEVDPAYSADILAGRNTAVIVYRSYRYDYRCTFAWNATAGTAYEVTDHQKKHPLTMYRWKKVNALWAARHDPVEPRQCEEAEPS